MKKLNEETLREFIKEHNIQIRREDTKGGVTKLYLDHCVFDETHTGNCAAIVIRPEGIGYNCFHDSCKNRKIGDFIKKYDPDFYKDDKFAQIQKQRFQEHKPPSVKRLQEIEEKDAEWLIPNYIPKGSISLLAGDGGTGKTYLWCNIAASVTNGGLSILEHEVPYEDTCQDKRDVLFFSSEDSTAVVLHRRLMSAGADPERILLVDMGDPNFDKIKFDSQELAEIIEEYKPALCVFDPIQSFIPATVNMGSRNAMRQCLSPLAALGEKYGTSFLIVLHTNKKQNVYGRTRIADSADIWDASRSVLMAGYTGTKGIMYLSHEKSNYTWLQDTILYSIENEKVVFQGTTDMRDADFVKEAASAKHPAPARDKAKKLILEYLKDGEWHKVEDLDNMLKSNKVSFSTLKRAKQELKDEEQIRYRVEGFNNKVFYVQLCTVRE